MSVPEKSRPPLRAFQNLASSGTRIGSPPAPIVYKSIKTCTNTGLLGVVVETISFRPSKKVVSEFKHLLDEEPLGKSELARTLFEMGLAAWRKKKALEAFAAGKTSFLSACHQAGVSPYEFLEFVKASRIAYVHVSESDLRQELELARR